ncbi:MAG TPA: ATP-binding cassette domain-containing protein, partial [Propionibacteriaceae bacterium]|nr:ATP-binding cassette domain-containing protein [Propionibacteriaceae bacterium]
MLQLTGVSKSFGAVVALRNADLALYAGSIHAVVGENGAGKSTLVKIMAGLYQRDAGTFEMDGRPAHFRST